MSHTGDVRLGEGVFRDSLSGRTGSCLVLRSTQHGHLDPAPAP